MSYLKKTFRCLDVFLKAGGVVANTALLLLFAYGTWKLWSMSRETYASLPEMPQYTPQEWASVMVEQKNWAWFLEVGKNVCKLWVLVVLTVGLGWMTLLGCRWLYRLVLQATGRLSR